MTNRFTLVLMGALIGFLALGPLLDTKISGSEIAAKMEKLEQLYKELYAFNSSSSFQTHGYGALGAGDWASRLESLSNDDELKTYIKTLVPESMETEFLFLQPLEPKHLWFLGRFYMNNGGKENKDTLVVKAKFKKLFRLHQSQKN